MGEEFYAIIKLISGEEIFSLISVDDNDGDVVIILQSPIVIKSFTQNGQSMMKVKPWIEISDEDIFVINYDKVITVTESKNKKLIDVYTKFVNDEDDDSQFFNTTGKVDISKTMGYVSSVEDARKSLESLYNIEDNKES
jgi:hypothetical protein